jgi:elongation factor 2
MKDETRTKDEGYDVATIYVGNLPYDLREIDLHADLQKTAQVVNAELQQSVTRVQIERIRVERLRPKRGFAYLEVCMSRSPGNGKYEDSSQAQALSSFISHLRNVSLAGRALLVERQGCSVVHELRRFCEKQSIPFPIFTQVTEEEKGKDGFLLRAQLRDGTLVCPPLKGATLKEAKRACAHACLDFLQEYCSPKSHSSPQIQIAFPDEDEKEPSSSMSPQSQIAFSVKDEKEPAPSPSPQSPIAFPVEDEKEQAPSSGDILVESDGESATSSQNIETKTKRNEMLAIQNTEEDQQAASQHGEKDVLSDGLDVLSMTRNCSIIAHVDHGKTTLSDSLLSKAGLLSKRRAGFECSLDTTEQEKERGITIHSTAVTLEFPIEQQLVSALRAKDGNMGCATKSTLEVNLIDCPGHVDFNAEVVASLRITDGAVVVVDAVEGVCVQTNVLLRQALAERVKPVLMLNKCDRLFVEKQLSANDAYDYLVSTILQVNSIIEDEGTKLGMSTKDIDDWKVFLEDGSAVIGSGYFGWAFDVDHVVRKILRAKNGGNANGCEEWDTASSALKAKLKKWKGLFRQEFRQVFVKRLLQPIETMHKFCLEKVSMIDEPDFAAFLDRQEVNTSKIPVQEISTVKRPKDLLRFLMKLWAPAATCLIKLISLHLPSPKDAQRVRLAMFYPDVVASPCPGRLEDSVVESMMTCSTSESSPLMIYITKVVQLGGATGSIAVGRLFSGHVKSGAALSILPSDYSENSPCGLVNVCYVKKLLRLKGGKTLPIENAKAGDIVGLSISKVEDLRGATLTSHPLPRLRDNLMAFAPLPLKASPVVRVAVKALRGGEHASKLRAALKKMAASDPCLQVVIDGETGESILAGAGELHLETAVQSLRNALGGGIPLRATPPMVSYREAVTKEASEEASPCLAKTANKLNRIYVTASKIPDDLVSEIQNGVIARLTAAERTRLLVSKYGWSKSHANKIWCFGPEIADEGKTRFGANVLVDSTIGLSNMDALKGDLQAAFQKVCETGPLTGEQLCGIRFDIIDAKIHPDAAHRRTAQIFPAGVRALSAAALSSLPALMEPLLEASISCQEALPSDESKKGSDVGAVYSLVGNHRATVTSHDVEMTNTGSHSALIKVALPVLNAGPFVNDVRMVTSGRAFVDTHFDRYALCLKHVDGGETHPLVTELRYRNRMTPDVPKVASLVDKL